MRPGALAGFARLAGHRFRRRGEDRIAYAVMNERRHALVFEAHGQQHGKEHKRHAAANDAEHEAGDMVKQADLAVLHDGFGQALAERRDDDIDDQERAHHQDDIRRQRMAAGRQEVRNRAVKEFPRVVGGRQSADERTECRQLAQEAARERHDRRNDDHAQRDAVKSGNVFKHLLRPGRGGRRARLAVQSA